MSKCNVCGIDRNLRIIFGLAIFSLVFIGPQTPWGWLGLIPFMTGVLGFCPFYPMAGFSTCAEEDKEAEVDK